MAGGGPSAEVVVAPGDAEAAVAPAAANEETPASVGVLGWLGFIILNFAAWGIIAVSSTLQVWLGFGVCFVYTALVMIMAALMPRWGDRFRAFENLLWVLASILLCVLGVYLSINVVCQAANECGSNSFRPYVPGVQPIAATDNLKELLPAGSGAALQAWASAGLSYDDREVQNYAAFGGSTFFNGKSGAVLPPDYYGEVLLRSDGATTVRLEPPLVQAEHFLVSGGDLYFFARMYGADNVQRDISLYKVSAGAVAAAPEVLVTLTSASGDDYKWAIKPSSLFESGGKLFFMVQDACQVCSMCSVFTIYESDGTAAGTKDLRQGGRCQLPDIPDSGDSSTAAPDEFLGWNANKPTSTLWSIMFLGVVPMIGLACLIMALKKLPGLILNIYYGVGALVILVYLLAETNGDNVGDFFKWFVTLYSAAGLVGITLPSLLATSLPTLLEEMKDWVVVLAGVPFLVVIHIDLEIPVASEAWKWIIYVFTAVVQMFVSVAVGRTVPMILGAIQLFVTSWKIAREIVRAAYGTDSMDQVQVLTILGLMAFQGIGIIVGAILYASRRTQIEEAVRGGLQRCLRRKAA